MGALPVGENEQGAALLVQLRAPHAITRDHRVKRRGRGGAYPKGVRREHGAEYYGAGAQILRRWPNIRRADPQKSGRIYYRPYAAGPHRVQLEPTLWVASPPLLEKRIALARCRPREFGQPHRCCGSPAEGASAFRVTALQRPGIAQSPFRLTSESQSDPARVSAAPCGRRHDR